jgi:hypothetical protein
VLLCLSDLFAAKRYFAIDAVHYQPLERQRAGEAEEAMQLDAMVDMAHGQIN